MTTPNTTPKNEEAEAAAIITTLNKIGATTTAKEWQSLRQDFDLHVGLVLKQDKLTKAKAIIQAYKEGTEGLNARLGQMKLPL